MSVNNDGRNFDDLSRSITLAQHTVYKRFLTELEQYALVKPSQILLDEDAKNCQRFIRLDELSCKKGEDILQKLTTVYHASTSLGCNLIVIVDVKKIDAPAQIYIGVRNEGYNKKYRTRLGTSFRTLKNGIVSNFPGTKIHDMPAKDAMPGLIESMFGETAKYISSVSCVASARDKSKTENKSFVQGIERLIDAMKGKAYTAVFIAEPISMAEQNEIRNGYESLYSSLSPFAKSVWSYNESNSHSVMENLSDSVSTTITEGTSHTQAHTVNVGVQIGLNTSRFSNETTSQTVTTGTNTPSAAGRVGQALVGASGLLQLVGTIATPICPAAGGALFLANGVCSIVGSAMQGTINTQSVSDTIANTIGNSLGLSGGLNAGVAKTTSKTVLKQKAATSGKTKTKGTTDTSTTGKTLQIENSNKQIVDMLKRIDEQLKRTQEGEDYGAYSCSVYFLSGKQESSLLAANTYRALMIGEGSAVESGAINSWNGLTEPDKVASIKEYLKRFVHPVFAMPVSDTLNSANDFVFYTPGTVVSGLELPLHLGLPTKSVYGLPVVEHAEFGRNVYSSELQPESNLVLGNIYHMGRVEKKSPVAIDIQGLREHTFITGSTGSGKSNAIYNIISKLRKQYEIPTLVIEPAKGEYKHVFGSTFHVFGTNPCYTDLFCINPFSFDSKIHVLEHIDRLIDIFNVCWPMYAAMPAVLKEAIELAYQNAGWDLNTSENKFDRNLYPCFKDVLLALHSVINHSDYSQEVKDNYTGSLITRVKSLTNGLNGQIFTGYEIDEHILFEENTIIDLSRVGSSETKSMIMGIIIMRLQEHRLAQGGLNLPLKHMTILEEAHNILKRTSTEQNSETANLVGKSVEILSNAIAEMRTYGEAFVIADQAPALMDMSVIRNTNTKIILRLPDESDRILVGKSAGLTDEQIVELVKLPSGVAAVYQNKWVEPVLCQIQLYSEEHPKPYEYIATKKTVLTDDMVRNETLQYILSGLTHETPDDDLENLRQRLMGSTLPSVVKTDLIKLLAKQPSTSIEEVYTAVANSFEGLDEAFESAKSAKDVDEWNNELLLELHLQTGTLSQACQEDILECVILKKAAELKADEMNYHKWMEYMGRHVM